jgi:hypothetical protein
MPRYSWDAAAGRYRDARGAFVPGLRGRFDALVDAERARVRLALERVAGGTASPAEFALELRDSVKLLETSATMLAVGGKAHAAAGDWAAAGGRISAQFAYVPRFVLELEVGLESDPTFVRDRLSGYAARADRYLTASVGHFENLSRGKLAGDGYEEKRLLASGGASCPSCERYASAGFGPVGALPGIGEQCECGGSCRCTFVRRRQVKRKALFGDDLTFDNIRELLSSKLNEGATPTDYGRRYWVRDMTDTWVVYEDNTDSGLYRRSYVIGDDQAVTLGDPERVAVRTKYDRVQMAAFSLAAGGATPSAVTWSGPIFRAGDYPDKGFSATAEEIAAAVEAFEPVRLNVEHKDSIFSGSFGELRRIWAEGQELHGEIVTPAWFRDDVVQGDRLSVSTEWDIEAKRLTGLATSLSPRVADAVLVAAFSRGEAAFAGKRNSSRDQTRIQAIHDHTTELGAACVAKMEETPMGDQTQQTTTHTAPAVKPTSFLDRLRALFGSATPEDLAALASAPAAAPAVSDANAPADARAAVLPSDEVAALRAENERLRAAAAGAVASEAASFADSLIGTGKRTPAERDDLVARFTDAATLDRQTPRTVTFSVDGQARTGTRVDELRAAESSRQGHGLLEERVDQERTRVLLSSETAKPAGDALSSEREAELMQASSFGAAVARERAKSTLQPVR